MLINREKAIAAVEGLLAKIAQNRYDRADESLAREVECISEQVTEALRALPVSDGWEDIATCPRDGTEILLYTDTSKSDTETLSYVEIICEGEHVKRVQMGHWCFLQKNWEKPIIGDPLFWRPLPAPPTIEEK